MEESSFGVDGGSLVYYISTFLSNGISPHTAIRVCSWRLQPFSDDGKIPDGSDKRLKRVLRRIIVTTTSCISGQISPDRQRLLYHTPSPRLTNLWGCSSSLVACIELVTAQEFRSAEWQAAMLYAHD